MGEDPITVPTKVTTPELVKNDPTPAPTECVPPQTMPELLVKQDTTAAASNISEQGPELTKPAVTATETLGDKNDSSEDENIASGAGVAGLRDILQDSNKTWEE